MVQTQTTIALDAGVRRPNCSAREAGEREKRLIVSRTYCVRAVGSGRILEVRPVTGAVESLDGASGTSEGWQLSDVRSPQREIWAIVRAGRIRVDVVPVRCNDSCARSNLVRRVRRRE